jgi:hypothetical protein
MSKEVQLVVGRKYKLTKDIPPNPRTGPLLPLEAGTVVTYLGGGKEKPKLSFEPGVTVEFYIQSIIPYLEDLQNRADVSLFDQVKRFFNL